MIHLSILIFAPLLFGIFAAGLPRIMVLGTLVPLVYAVMMVADFDAAGGLQHVTDDAWIEALGIHYKLGVVAVGLYFLIQSA